MWEWNRETEPGKEEKVEMEGKKRDGERMEEGDKLL